MQIYSCRRGVVDNINENTNAEDLNNLESFDIDNKPHDWITEKHITKDKLKELKARKKLGVFNSLDY